ncbi:MAG: DUF3108 domain-containing protein [Gallionella sp.]
MLNRPARRIAIAIALSVLLHFVILWLPYFQLPHAKIDLPPLSVTLENLPKPVEQPARKTAPAQVQEAKLIVNPDKSPLVKHGPAMARMDKAEEATKTRPFPKHLRLTFIVYADENGSRTGEISQRLDISGGRYTLKSEQQTAGLSSLRNSDSTILVSNGKIGDHGLQPDTFSEEQIDPGGKQSLQATFDWSGMKLRFSDGSEIPLPADAQDALSYMYQISQLPMTAEFFTLPIADGTQLRQEQIEIGVKEYITTPMGKLYALHLRRMHADREAYFEIWLGLEYRLLPLKFRQVDSSGRMTEEYVISDIRAADK